MSLILSAAIVAALPLATPETLDAVTVTASRRPRPVAETLADVSVIERAEIEASQSPDLLDLLRLQPGVDLSRTGGSGQASSLFLRGTNSNQVLFLVDGVRVASTNTGATAWEHLPLDQIERIEIVRGPRASYYGSDAIGGVIAITTRELRGASALLRLGSDGRRAGAVGYGVEGEQGALSVQLGAEHYDGFSATLPGNFSYDPDNDGYRHRDLGIRARHQFGSQQLSFSGLATRQDVEFDQGLTDVRQHATALTLDGPLGKNWNHRLTLGGARDDLTTPVYFSRFVTRRENLDWVHDLALNPADHLVFGLSAQRERGRSIDTFSGDVSYSASLQHQAAFVGWQGQRGPLEHELALRYDQHDTFGGKATAQAALGWRFDPGRVYLSWGQGFRAPNLNELYSPGFGGLFAGNPDLDPERANSLELGLDTRFGAMTFGANLYRTRIRDLVAFQGNASFQAINVARAAIDGLELTVERQFDALRLGANATWQDARDADTGLDLLRRPRSKSGVTASYRFESAVVLSSDVTYVSERRDFSGDLHPYSLAGVRVEWPFSAGWSLGARLSNAFDRQYSFARDFASPGREFMVSLRWQER
jgi:vitamin B12 transporter